MNTNVIRELFLGELVGLESRDRSMCSAHVTTCKNVDSAETVPQKNKNIHSEKRPWTSSNSATVIDDGNNDNDEVDCCNQNDRDC